MFEEILREAGGRGLGVLLGLVVGSSTAALVSHLRRRKERSNILSGDARDTVVISQHIVTTETRADLPGGEPRVVPKSLRIRSLGQSQLDRVVPNGYLASVLMHRSGQVSPHKTLVSMEGPEGSYLLETLTNFVCDRVANAPFNHDLYVMAPCCEPADFANHQPLTIIIIKVRDLLLFTDWNACREVTVEHGSDGARLLTLRELAHRFRAEQDQIAALRRAGQRTRYIETSYILDLALDERTAELPTKPVPWGRYEQVLSQLNLE